MGYGSATGSAYNDSNDLLPHRLDSVNLQNVERGGLAGITLVAFVSVILCVVHGLQFHLPHLFMGVSVAMSATQLLLISRAYGRDEIQDRKLVYFSGLVTFLLASSGLYYASTWTEAANCFPAVGGVACHAGSNNYSYYNPNVQDPYSQKVTGGCLSFSQFQNPLDPVTDKHHGNPCQKVSIRQGVATMVNLPPFGTSAQTVTWKAAQQMMQACFPPATTFPKWGACVPAPSPSPSPSPGPSPSPHPSPPSPSPALGAADDETTPSP